MDRGLEKGWLVASGLAAALLVFSPAFSFFRLDVPFDSVRLVETVFAEDDDENDNEDEEDDEEKQDDDQNEEKKTVYVTRYETRTVSRVVTVVPEEYTRDTDGDGLVDGIDPNPTIHQKEFFTDTDGDSIPNAFDSHHDEDDFAYFNEEDADGDGIIDSYVWVPES